MLLKELGEEETYYYHPDHLGSVSVVSNHRGEPYERVEYLPFGELWIEETDPATSYIPFRFTSKEYDEETGLYYHGARYYEPRLSRWMSADPAGFALINPMDEDGKPRAGYSVIEATNWYSYVSNNPVLYVDPTGEEQTIGVFGGRLITVRDITGTRKNDPMANPSVTGSFADHQSWNSSTPGIDFVAEDTDVEATHDGLIVYDDSGDRGYGFHAELTYVDKKGEYKTETFGHMARPENVSELIDKGEEYIDAGSEIGDMGNTGGVYTTAGGTQKLAPVTEEQRAQGYGSHLHWDKKGTLEEVPKYTNPYDE